MELPVQALWAVNRAMNALFGPLFAPIGRMPGWLSLTVLSAIVGVLSLAAFKRVSNQGAIGRARDRIDGSLLAVRLFRDSDRVALRSLAAVFAGAFRLLWHSALPMAAMIAPVSLLLAQMGLWYQSAPLPVGAPAVVRVDLSPGLAPMPEVSLEPSPAVAALIGPVRVESRHQVFFKVRPRRAGYHTLVFRAGGERFEKRIAAGAGFMRQDPKRPGPDFIDALLHPLEKPFPSRSAVRSIAVDCPARTSWIFGADNWIFYFFAVSMIFALAAKPFLKVRL